MRKNIIIKEEAIEIAKNADKEVNRGQEYKDAFYFFVDDGNDYIGGSVGGFVIMKDGGALKRPYEYFMHPGSKAVEIGGEFEI